jgi:hypothetical protein
VQLFDRHQLSSQTTTCRIKITWHAWKSSPPPLQGTTLKCSPICETNDTSPTFAVANREQDTYFEASGNDLLLREELGRICSLIGSVYDNDPLGPRTLSAVEAPPVRRIKAVYGINLPTEVGCVYRRHKGFVDSDHKLKNIHVVDTSAKFVGHAPGYTCDGGIILETPNVVYTSKAADGTAETKRCCGDGTVPYWSLSHVREWQSDDCEVTIDEIDGAEHREILADGRFHTILVDYITKREGEVAV